jgi:succinate dehydrogenase / fumarate reductase cytochrome b subunit
MLSMKKFTNIDLMSIKSYNFPIMAMSSILHRVSGVILLVGVPLSVYGLSCSLSSSVGYDHAVAMFTKGVGSIFFWMFLSAITYHVYAGIRHMIMDAGFAESLVAAKTTSIITILLGVLTAAFWGCLLWL